MQKQIHETKHFSVNYEDGKTTRKLADIAAGDPTDVLTKIIFVKSNDSRMITASELAEILEMLAERQVHRETHNVYS